MMIKLEVILSADTATISHSNDLTSETGMKEDVACASMSVGHEDQQDENASTSEIDVWENAGVDTTRNVELDEDSYCGDEDLERLMCEIGSMPDSLRLVPDFQRWEMAATDYENGCYVWRQQWWRWKFRLSGTLISHLFFLAVSSVSQQYGNFIQPLWQLGLE